MAQPVDVDVSREMRAPAAALWEVLGDLRRLPEWLQFASELEERSSDTVAEGVTYTVKPHRSFEPKTRWRITAVEPPRRQVHSSEMPMLRGVTSTIELLDGGDGRVRAHVHWVGEPSNFAGRLMRGMFQRRITEQWERSLEQLDRLAGAAGA
jgi:uncharacterized protein YndB with AHSA1/START domain